MATTREPLAIRCDDVLRTLFDTAGAIRDVAQVKQLVGTIAEQVRRMLDSDAVTIYLLDNDTHELVNLTGDDASLCAGDGIAGEALAEQRPVLLPTPGGDTCTAAAVPLIVGQQALGVLLIDNHNQPRTYTPEDLGVLVLLAALLGPALDRARWRTESELQRRSALEQVELLTQVLDQLPSGVIVLDARGYVMMSNPAAQRGCEFEIQDDRPWADQVAGFVVRDSTCDRLLRAEDAPAARALKGETVRGTELLVHQVDRNVDTWIRIDAVPLRHAEGQASGAVLVYTDVTRERTLARDLAATALEHAKLLGKLTEQHERLEHLAGQVAEPWLQQASAPPTAQ
jgi:PAS domain-containing protein